MRWTERRALVGSGSPFPPVEINGRAQRISQVNNSFIFPGLALGILVSQARRVTDGMVMAAAKALAALSPSRSDKSAALLPPVADSRKVAMVVAEALARQAIAEGKSEIDNPDTLPERFAPTSGIRSTFHTNASSAAAQRTDQDSRPVA